jgi:hypothetical protein
VRHEDPDILTDREATVRITVIHRARPDSGGRRLCPKPPAATAAWLS